MRGGELSAPESLFAGARDGRWREALDEIQAASPGEVSSPVFLQATSTFVSAFLASLPGDGFPDRGRAEVAERILLFMSAGRLQLEDGHVASLVRRSLTFWSDDPERRVGLAKMLPADPESRRILESAAAQRKEIAGMSLTHPRAGEQQVHEDEPSVLPLFRSLQELEFHHALRSFRPQHLIGVNVSIHAVVDLDRVRPSLSRTDLSLFFRGLIDFVLFDPERGFRPVTAFELDSPLHDDGHQRERDGRKDRILALSGLRLIRIRPERARTSREEFLALLKNAAIDTHAQFD